MVIPTGYTALDLIGFTDKGAYDGAATYVKNDLVHHDGNVWRVLVDDVKGIIPSEGIKYTLFIGEPTNLVERIIAPFEINPSKHAWTVGRQFIYNDLLYEVIDTIAIGDSLVTYESDSTNANIKLALPVETQLLALKELYEAIVDVIADNRPLPIKISSVAALPRTITSSKIKSNHVVEGNQMVLSNSSAMLNDWEVATSNGSLTINGTISGTTDISFNLVPSQDALSF